MGLIKDAFDFIYRDWVTAGIPASGANEPVKSEIRSLGSTIEQLLSTAGISNTIYETTAAGIAATTDGQLFLVKGDGVNSFADLYKNVGGVAVAQGISLPSQEAVDALFNEAIDAANQVGEELAQVVGDSDDDKVTLTDPFGRGLAEFGGTEARIAAMGFEAADGEHAALTDRVGRVRHWLTPRPRKDLDINPLWRGKLVGVPGVPVTITVPSLLADRRDFDRIICALGGGMSGISITGERQITIDPGKLGAAAKLWLRPKDGDEFTVLDIPVVKAPVPPPSAAPFNVLLDGDSISQYQGAWMLSEILAAWGYAPNFVGTIRGAGAGHDGNSDAADGPLGEARPGWQSANMTGRYAAPYRFKADGTLVTDGSAGFGIVEDSPAARAAYLAAPATSRRLTNPYLRVGTGGDAENIKRNGLVLDFGKYAADYGIPTPAVFAYGLGRNNSFFRNDTDPEGLIYADDMLVYQRLRAAWPSVKIIRFLPAIAASRDNEWDISTAAVIRGIMKAYKDIADPNIILAPTWAMMPIDSGYALNAGTTDPYSGAVTADLADDVHPIDETRAALWLALAPYIAAAAAGAL